MERFAEEHFLQLVEQYRVTHTQLVPTMFSRMLKLPEAVRRRYDLSSLEAAVHGAAPCPVPVKQAMIDWWGPVIHEYYSATEGMGLAMCDSAEWLAHPGTVGRVVLGELHVLDDEMREVPTGKTGRLWFKTASPFEYFNDPEKTAASHRDGYFTLGDVGYFDEDGYLFLTGRTAECIISGGVNIYPQEIDNELIKHPAVEDSCAIGVPNAEWGEEVKVVLMLKPGYAPSDHLTAEIMTFARERLAGFKIPRSVDYVDDLPRSPAGKIQRGKVRAPFWAGRKVQI